MKHLWLSVLLGGMLALWPFWAIATPSDSCPAVVRGRIDAIAQRPEFRRSRWGILVQTLDTGETLIARDADHYFIPASNVKLLTTAAALTSLGPDFRIRTSIHHGSSTSTPSTSTPASETVLRLVGRGDPTLTPAHLTSLAQMIQQQGITQVDRMLVDDHYFTGAAVHPNWEWEDLQADYGAAPTSLILNRNAATLTLLPQQVGQPLHLRWANPLEATQWQLDHQATTGPATGKNTLQVEQDVSSIRLHLQGQLPLGADPEIVELAIPNPTSYVLQHWQQVLRAQGIAVTQLAIAPRPPASSPPVVEPEIAAILSPSLAELLMETNQQSNNLYAEVLLRLLGTVTPVATLSEPPSTADTPSALVTGLQVVESTLTQLGVDADGYDLVDGSGLSRHNLVTPTALVQTLQAMVRSPHARVFRQSLSVAGINGTLRNRFRNTPVQGHLSGKTGALSGVVSLSGYLTPPQVPPLAFSILLNHFDQPVRTVRPALDEMVLLLMQLRSC